MTSLSKPEISIVIPVFNEEPALPALFVRLTSALAKLGRHSEIVFVDDGSNDGSLLLLETFGEKAEVPVTIVELSRNVGQYTALLAAARETRGEIVVILDADLQNPPEEIHSLVAKIDAGHDVVTGHRVDRKDSWHRNALSRLMNILRARLTPVRLNDHGCMLAAYRRDVVDRVTAEKDARVFLPAVAAFYARHPAEVAVRHELRVAGATKYTLKRLFKAGYEVGVSFSMAPFQVLPLLGGGMFVIAVVAGAVTVFAAYRGYSSPGLAGVLIALNVGLLGLVLAALGLVGEYVFRIHQIMIGRPGYIIRSVNRFEKGSRDKTFSS